MKRLLFTLMLVCAFASGFAQFNVIDAELQEVLNRGGDEMISVNVVLKSQLDPSVLKSRVGDVGDGARTRAAVVSEMKAFAEKSQRDVFSIVKSAEMRGEADAVVSHWLSNFITCTISGDLIYYLSTHDDVAYIGYNADRYVLWDEEGESVETLRSLADNVSLVNADDVWEMGYTGKGVVVAVIDSGVNYNHADLADHLWDGGTQYPNHGYNTYDNNNDPMDGTGHGSHCAGIVCGDGTSGTQTGIAPEATLMCVKAINNNGNANANSIVSGMEFAVEHGADVLSMSLGIAMSSVADRTVIRQACESVLATGVIASVAVGNEGTSLNSNPVPDNVRVPGSCPPPWIHQDQVENAGGRSCVVAVGAVDNTDVVASVSSHGPVTWQNTSYNDYPYNPGIGLIRPDVCAPGVNIVSLDYSTDDDYVVMTGTSMAAPCVAGVMCLMLSRDNTLVPEEISEILETTAVKLSDTKNNRTGSGRVDALEAINAMDVGTISLKNISVDDSDGNALLNPGESVTLNLDFENTSAQSYSDVTAVMRCDDDMVNITKAEVEVGGVSGNAEFSINDFSLSLSDAAPCKTKVYVDVEFYSNDERIAMTRGMVVVYDNALQYVAVFVENDDNGNGVLEAGETADLGVAVNNAGNEMVLGLKGRLSSNSGMVSINDDEADFGAIAPDGSAMAYYNVTLSDDASDADIPFLLEVDDRFGGTNSFDISYRRNCEVVYELHDDYGDGWLGAKITAVYDDGSPSDTYTISSGDYAVYEKNLATGVEVVLEWKKGGFDAECSYTVSYDNGALIYSGRGTHSNGEFFRWTNNCSCQNMLMDLCEPVGNFNITKGANSIGLSWEAPETENVVLYEVYRDTKLIASTNDLSYTDDMLYADGTYVYNVRPVYDDCNGALVGGEVDFVVGNEEYEYVEVSIYPNPTKDRFVVSCVGMTNIEVFGVMGAKVMSANTDDDVFVIEGLEPGMYFVKVKSENGDVIRKVVKY